MSMNENDQVFDAIIDYVAGLQREHPRRSYGWTAKYIAHRLEDQYELHEIIEGVEYLASKRWLASMSRERIKYYKLGPKAIEKMRPSSYASKPMSPINISGSGNILVMNSEVGTINQTNNAASEQLLELIKLLATSELPADIKKDAIADADAIRSQLLKQHPNREVIGQLWKGVEAAATTAGASAFAQKIWQLLTQVQWG